MSYSIKQNDTLPAFRAQLQDSEGAALDLSAASDVSARFSLNDQQATSRACTVVGDGTTGEVTLEWQEGDFPSAGFVRVEFTINWGTGEQTVPSNDVLTFRVYERIS